MLSLVVVKLPCVGLLFPQNDALFGFNVTPCKYSGNVDRETIFCKSGMFFEGLCGVFWVILMSCIRLTVIMDYICLHNFNLTFCNVIALTSSYLFQTEISQLYAEKIHYL